MSCRTEVAATGLAFPEGPCWPAGPFRFTDQQAQAIYALDGAGRLQTVAHTDDLPDRSLPVFNGMHLSMT